MNPVSGFVEFYVTCNPPLRPNGVRYVVNSAAKAFLNDEIIELLFEPEIPWFKVITRSIHQTLVYEYLQSLLGSILEEETRLLDSKPIGHDGSDSNTTLPDVDITVANPRVMPWPMYVSADKIDTRLYDAFRYPATIRDVKHRTIWREIEKRPGKSLHVLFSHLRGLWTDSNLPTTVSQLETTLKCLVTHNLRADVLYIGTDEGTTRLQEATKKLENLLYALRMTKKTATHVIDVEIPGQVRISYRWLSQLGLARKTYIQAPEQELAAEYARLMSSATWRLLSDAGDGVWVSDSTVYPVDSGMDYSFKTPQSGFEEYSHTVKTPATVPLNRVSRVFDKASATSDVLLSGKASMPSSRHTAEPKIATTRSIKHQKHKYKSTGEGSGRAAATDERTLESADASQSSKNPVQWAATVVTSPPPSLGISSSRDLVVKWRDNVEKACQPELPDSEVDDLMVFEPPDQQTPKSASNEPPTADNNMGVVEPSVLRGASQPVDQPDDLISFGDVVQADRHPLPPIQDDRLLHQGWSLLDDIPEGVSQGTPLTAKLPLVPVDTKNVDKIQPQLSQNAPEREPTGDESVQFGKCRTTPRQFFRTMKQGAGRPQSGRSSAVPSHKGASESQPSSTRRAGNSEFPAKTNGCRKAGKDAELQMKQMINALQVTPGNVSLKAKFGRFYYKNIPHSMVDLGEGPDFGLGEVIATLNDSSFPQQCLGFSTILSREHADAGRLPLLELPRRAKWGIPETCTFYDFSCSMKRNGRAEQFVVEIDAESFEYRPRGANEELSTVYVHCPQRAWDMKVCSTRSSALHLLAKYQEIASDLTQCLGISLNEASQLLIEVVRPQKLGVAIDRVEVRHVARHRQSESGSVLTVSTTRAMIRRQGPPNKTPARTYWGPPVCGTESRYVEASLSSSHADKILEENMNLEIGDRATWRCDEFDALNVMDDICEPAFEMVRQMDQIGHTNDNGEGYRAYPKYHDTLAEAEERRGKFDFW